MLIIDDEQTCPCGAYAQGVGLTICTNGHPMHYYEEGTMKEEDGKMYMWMKDPSGETDRWGWTLVGSGA